MNKVYTVPVLENEEGEPFIEFPPEALEGLGWNEGDTLIWKDNKDGTWTIVKKQEETDLVLVETISMYRMRYLVEVPKGKSEWALDTVSMNEAREFSQKHLDEIISSHRVVTKEQALKICDEDNDYAKSWTEELKLKNFFTRIGDEVKSVE